MSYTGESVDDKWDKISQYLEALGRENERLEKDLEEMKARRKERLQKKSIELPAKIQNIPENRDIVEIQSVNQSTLETMGNVRSEIRTLMTDLDQLKNSRSQLEYRMKSFAM